MEDLWLMLAAMLYNVFFHCLQILVSKKQDVSERRIILASSNLVRNPFLSAAATLTTLLCLCLCLNYKITVFSTGSCPQANPISTSLSLEGGRIASTPGHF